MKQNSTLRFAFTATLPVMAGYIVLGIGFGVLLQDKGYAWWWATLMSLTIYAGSMQYVAVDLLAGGASLIATALMTVMVNLRHLFYGITMLTKYNKAGKNHKGASQYRYLYVHFFKITLYRVSQLFHHSHISPFEC